MRTQTLTRQLIAFLAAAVLVFTVMYVVILWRNQSASRVMSLGSGQLLYQTPDFALGVTHANHGKTAQITLLRYSQDGGWVIAGAGQWIARPTVLQSAQIMLVPDESNGPAGGMWFCAIRKDPQLTAIQLWDPMHPANTQTFSFHDGGIVEPAIVSASTIIRGLQGHRVAFSTPWSPAN